MYHTIASKATVSPAEDKGTGATTHYTIDSRGRDASMYHAENKSEVARIRELIALEYESVELAVRGLSITSRHDFIAKRQENKMLPGQPRYKFGARQRCARNAAIKHGKAGQIRTGLQAADQVEFDPLAMA